MVLTEEVVNQIQKHISDLLIIYEAHRIKMIFDSLNTSFSQVHKMISHNKPIPTQSLPEYQAIIDAYMDRYRTLFPNKTIPKQHILEHHCIDCISQNKFGLGMLGEQGTEASHQSISKFEQRACGINNSLSKLEFVMKSHLLEVAPSLRYPKPTTKKKASKEHSLLQGM